MTPPPPAPMTADEHEPERLTVWQQVAIFVARVRRLIAGRIVQKDRQGVALDLRPQVGGSVFSTIRRWLAIVGAAVIAGGVVLLIGYALGRGKSRGELAAATGRADSLTRARAAVDTVYARDTVRLTRWLTRWDSVRVVDTLVRDSVVYVRRDVADSTVAACLVTLGDCERQRALADSLVRVLRDMPAPEGARPWYRDRVALTVGAGMCYAGGMVTPGGQVGVGVALWRWP